MDDPLVVSLKRKTAPSAPPVPGPVSVRSRKTPWKLYGALALTMMVLVSGGYAFMSGGLYEGASSMASALGSQSDSSEDVAAREVSDLILAVGALIVLPEGETPTVATVSDPEKLKDQPFFARAKVGDKVLMYTQAKKAYLYDPAANILLEVAPITTESP